MFQNNYNVVNQRAANRPNINRSIGGNFMICGDGYYHGNASNIGMRLFYGVSIQITDKISFDSQIKVGGFETQVYSNNFRYINYPALDDYYYGYGENLDYRIAELGFGLRYAIF